MVLLFRIHDVTITLSFHLQPAVTFVCNPTNKAGNKTMSVETIDNVTTPSEALATLQQRSIMLLGNNNQP